MSELTYLASPYNHESFAVREARWIEAMAATAYLMQSGVVYSPIVHNHPIAARFAIPTGWDYWQHFDTVMLRRCTGVVVLCIDGWRESAGIAGELEIAAELGLPVAYLTPVPGGYCLVQAAEESP